jgi:glycerol-3-phosphate O-acyltransferase
VRPLVEAVVNRERFSERLPALADELAVSDSDARKAVRERLAELVAIPSNAFREFAGRISKTMVSLGYESPVTCDPQQLERLRTLMREHPVALLWTHKSHVDGAALIATLHENGFPMLHSFGGINMAFAGVGYSGRRAGIIYIRRSFGDDPAYKFALRQYLGYLMEKRAPFSWSFEGTRSRIGKLMPPRLGLLKYLVEAADATGTEGLRLVPVSVSYDLISDVDDYAVEETGRRKQAENLGWFLSYLRRLRTPMGRIYMNFGEPVEVDAAQALADEDNALYKLAFRVAVNANRVTPITLPALVSLVLLGALPRALTAQELSDRVMAVVRWARERNIPLTSSYDNADRSRLDEVMEMMIRRDLLTRFDSGLETVYGIGEKEHSVAGYYRNTVIHFFVNKAIAELSLMRVAPSRGKDKAALLFEEARWLRDLFKHEFYFSPRREFREEIREELERVDPQWEAAVSAGENSTTKLLSRAAPLVAHATLLDFLDAYLIMARLLEKAEDSETRSKAEWVALALQYGRQAYLQRAITSDASIGRQVLDNAYRWFEGEGLAPPTAENRDALRRVCERIEKTVRRAELLASFASIGRWDLPPAG